MKRILAVLFVALICFGAISVSAANTVKVVVDGTMVNFDQPPVILEGRTLVPVRAVAEKIGATVGWNGETQTVTVVHGNIGVALAVGNKKMPVTNLYSGRIEIIHELDVPPQNVNGRTLMPIRALAEALGCKVAYNAETSTVEIYTPNYDPSKARHVIVIGE